MEKFILKHKKNLIIDFEFTGLDNKYFDKNEILAFSILDIDNPCKKDCFIFKTDTPNSIGSKLVNQITKNDITVNQKFSAKFFYDVIRDYCWDITDIWLFWFGISTDKSFMRKYDLYWQRWTRDWYNFDYQDISDIVKLIDIKIDWLTIEEQMLINGNRQEVVYKLLTWKDLKNHTWTHEVEAQYDMIQVMLWQNVRESLKYVPFGWFKWMSIIEYCWEEEKRAYGYAMNNTDIFAISLALQLGIIE